jgi:hypothetical protein
MIDYRKTTIEFISSFQNNLLRVEFHKNTAECLPGKHL